MTEPAERDREMAREVVNICPDLCYPISKEPACLCIRELNKVAQCFAIRAAEADAAGYARGKAEMRERAAKVAHDAGDEEAGYPGFRQFAYEIERAIRALED